MYLLLPKSPALSQTVFFWQKMLKSSDMDILKRYKIAEQLGHRVMLPLWNDKINTWINLSIKMKLNDSWYIARTDGDKRQERNRMCSLSDRTTSNLFTILFSLCCLFYDKYGTPYMFHTVAILFWRGNHKTRSVN
jgi:hypothetical protein